MKLYSYNFYRKNNNGFTLIEMIASVIILGIIATIAAPNLIALFSHHKVNNAMNIINGAVKEAQRQAQRQGITCTITINTAARTITGNPATCLAEQRNIDDSPENTDEVTVITNLAPPNIVFTAKGNTITGGTIVVFSNFTDTQRCFVIAPGLGITRTGDYNGLVTDPLDPEDCDSN